MPYIPHLAATSKEFPCYFWSPEWLYLVFAENDQQIQGLDVNWDVSPLLMTNCLCYIVQVLTVRVSVFLALLSQALICASRSLRFEFF